MISEEEAREKILKEIQPLPARSVPLAHARDYFVARRISAQLPLPLFDNSAMDGYAVITNDCRIGARLRVVGEQPAGVDQRIHVGSGEAVRIFTGAPIPEGADAVVMQEDVRREGDKIVINTEVERGEFVRRRGCDLSEGQVILEAGDRLRAERLALLAAEGFSDIEIGGPARAAILSTGDELAQARVPPRRGEIHESNSILLRGLLEEYGVTVESTSQVADQRKDLKAALESGIEYDALVISGGMSVGERDLVRPVLQELGAEIDLWQVAMKPGRPFLFGRAGKCAVFGLPGNPVSAFVTFLLLVRPALLKMMGANEKAIRLPMANARLASNLQNDSDRPHYIRGESRHGEFRPIGRQESHALFGLSRSNALLLVGPGEKLSTGETVKVHLWA